MLSISRNIRSLTAVAAAICVVATGCGSSKKAVTATTVPSVHTSTTVEAAALPTAVTMKITVTNSSTSSTKVTNWVETDSLDGSYVSKAQDDSDDEAFDSKSRTLTTHLSSDGHSSLNIINNASPAPPDEPTRQGAALAQYVASLQASADPTLTPTTVLGRSAYRSQFNVNSPTIQFDHADVTIDAQTGLMLLINTTKGGKPYIRWEVTNFGLNPDLTNVSFTIPQQKDDDVNQSDGGFIDTQLDLVKSQVGYDPITPRVLPTGFVLTRVMTAAAAGETSGINGSNPQNQDVVAEQFTNNWQSLYVTLRATGGDPAKWTDPLATVPAQFGGGIQAFAVSAGAMAPAKGQSVISPAESPHVWAAGTALVTTVSGPFSAATLAAAANSLG